jgi:signal transduction histidine kinase
MGLRGTLLSGLLLLTAPPVHVAAATPAAVSSTVTAAQAESVRPVPPAAELPVPNPPVQRRAPLSRTVLMVLLIATLLALALLTIALLALRRSRNRIAAANAELHQTNVSLERTLKARTDFLATTSHEIRTPLSGILGMTQVLLADRRLDGDLRERIDAVHGAGETMKALVDDILDIAKIESGNLAVERAPVALRPLLVESAQLWRAQADRKGVRIDIDVADCPERIEGDGVRLRQILCNLLSNALKFTASGAVGLKGGVESGDGSEWLVLRVTDTGIGIAPEQQEMVFEKYRQADGSISRRFGGTGLGLAICRSLVEAMGGTIALESRVGDGSTFTVRLPLLAVATAASPAQLEGDPQAQTLADSRLLIVEQNALTRRILCNMLHGHVGGIEAVATVQEAGDLLAAGGIDHVVADAAGGRRDATDDLPTIQQLASWALTRGARMTLLFAPGLADDAARLVAVHPEVQPIAKPIAAPALIDALSRLYWASTPAEPERRIFAAASSG